MLKKENRFLDFSVNLGKYIDSPLFKIKYFFKNGSQVKIGVVVSKKVDKRAVVRNETKRVIKKVLAGYIDKIKKGTEIVFYVKKPLRFEEIGEVQSEIDKSLIKIKQ